MHIFRITVRGQFHDLTPAARATLLAEADDHEHLQAAFTEAGTLTYDRRLGFFSFRYQLRERDDDHPDAATALAAATARAMDRASATLTDAGVGFRDLRTQATDMADMWADPPERG